MIQPLRSPWTRRGRLGTWLALSLIWSAAAAFLPAAPAQEEQAEVAAAPEEAGAPDVNPAAAAISPETTDIPATQAPKSMLRWAIEASGPIGFFILCLSIYFTALVIRLFLEYRLSEAVPPGLVEKLDTFIRERKFQEAYDACRDDNSFLARLVRTGIANLPNGKAEAKEAMQGLSEEITVGMESRISYLATIGTLGPMIGLVGTVWGMIQSFQELATTVGGQARPEKLAEGISTALFITLEGVSLSVPAIFFFALFRNRIAQMSIEANRVADRTIAALYASARTAKAPVAGTAS